ncbi:MAG: hypothetical protein EXR75_13250 [Myxococcales bacterium]|nr:hypothetical protein [Myxococcales bacterium]
MNTIKRFVRLVGASVLIVGCADAGPAGQWQSRDKLSNGERNQLVLADDLDVDLTLHARVESGDDLVRLVFDGTWATDKNGDHDLVLTCKYCDVYDGLDFELECHPDTVELNCDASPPFAEYGFFEFERVEE